MSTPLDLSTIAMSLYNVLVSGECDLDEARTRLARHGFLLPAEEIARAADALVSLGRVSRVAGDLYRAMGPPGLVVISRDRNDAWNGWKLDRSPRVLDVTLDGFLKPQAAQR